MAAKDDILQACPEILLSLACFVFFYYLCQVRRRSKAPINWPLVGMMPAISIKLHCLHDWVTEVLAETGCNYYVKGPWFLDFDFLGTSDPANVHHMFNVNFSNYPKGEEYRETFDILGDGIFNADGESWKMQRMRAHAILSSQKFRGLVASSIRSKVETSLLPLLDVIAGKGSIVDLQDVFLRLTFDSTHYLVFGVDPGCLSIDFPTIPFAKAMDDAMGALLFRHIVPHACWKLLRWLNVGEEKKLARAREVIDTFIAESIKEKKRLLRSSNNNNANADRLEERNDILSSYITEEIHEADQTVGEEKCNLGFDKFLRDTVVNLMLAGRDTTGVGLGWFFWLLAQNPIVEKKILEELNSKCSKVRSNSNGFITFDPNDIGSLVYLHAAFCESLRLYPPVPFEHKGAVQTDTLPSGHKAEAGKKVLVSIYSMGRMEGIWGKDCLEFRPERWITEKGRLRHEPSFKFLSFNSGPRTCLGKEVAFIQMKTVAAAVIYNFRVEVVQGHVVEPKLSVILQMKNGLQVRLKRRAYG